MEKIKLTDDFIYTYYEVSKDTYIIINNDGYFGVLSRGKLLTAMNNYNNIKPLPNGRMLLCSTNGTVSLLDIDRNVIYPVKHNKNINLYSYRDYGTDYYTHDIYDYLTWCAIAKRYNVKDLPVPINLSKEGNTIVYLNTETAEIIDADIDFFEDADLVDPESLTARVKINGIHHTITFSKDCNNTKWSAKTK